MHHSEFVHLHLHTKYSLLDGANTIEAIVDAVDRYKMPALAITDHGNMFGAIEFYQTATKKGVKPIIGCEAYIAPKSRLEKKKTYGIRNASFHLILLGVQVVATGDCHYLRREDSRAHEILLCIQTGTNINDPQRLKFSTDEFYMKSPEEMQKLRKCPVNSCRTWKGICCRESCCLLP